MSFQSRRLRVQLPCGEGGGSLVDLTERQLECNLGTIRPTICRGVTLPNCPDWSEVVCGFVSHHCRTFASCQLGSCAFHTCGFVTPVGVTPFTELTCGPTPVEIEPDPEDPSKILLHPDDLVHLKRQLEAQLDQIAALAQQKEQIEGQLEQIQSIQTELEKRSAEE